MSDELIAVKPEIAAKARVTAESHRAMTAAAAREPDAFWGKEAGRIAWMKAPTKIKNVDFTGPVSIKWFEDGVLNASVSCLDRHLATRGDQVAIIWEGDDPNSDSKVTYRELHEQVCRLANGLRSLGVKKGDRVCIYLPMIVEAAVAMLACARVGAIHSIVFGGFSPDSLSSRIQDSECKVLITADEGRRGGRKVALKTNADEALKTCPSIQAVIVVKNTGGNVPMQAGRDHAYEALCAAQALTCEPEPMNAEDPLFILYTSGSTGKPKGVLHTTAGYMVWASYTHELVFDYRPGEVYWCTADVGWVTGHTYIVYGPLANGATTLMFEGVPNYPSVSRFWDVVDKHQVNIFYTAPTAIRALMRDGEEPVKQASRKSLRVLGSVGEPINPEAWLWYYRVVGEERCPIVDTWWQTETGGILISPLPGAVAQSQARPPCRCRASCRRWSMPRASCWRAPPRATWCCSTSWPGQMRTIYGDHERFAQTYFSTYPGMYFTGDGARRDADGYYWITGRVDDVINVSGHRMGTAEIESALVAHPKVAEAAVVGMPHDLKGQGIYCYVTLKTGEEPTDALKKELVAWVRKEIGPIASPDAIQWAPGLPKTRSGKIMRRILRKIAANETDGLGDTSTLADPAVVQELVENRVG
ncbi:acetate--CoA ligase [Dankookia sp. P2]|uniref:acetate--CoA ligase n=1 Tax=Dankookia sp. P2 TaxID=3423955 RepID=UPI003D66BDDD